MIRVEFILGSNNIKIGYLKRNKHILFKSKTGKIYSANDIKYIIISNDNILLDRAVSISEYTKFTEKELVSVAKSSKFKIKIFGR